MKKPLDLSAARRFPHTCHVGVERKGEFEACDKPAIGVMLPSEWEKEEFGEDVPPYPVCVFHATVGRMVTLAELFSS